MLRTLKSPVTHACLYAAFIFALSSMPDPPVLGPMPLNDKLKHFALYGVFAALVYRAVIPRVSGRWAPAVWTFLVVAAYGATDEFHQRFTLGRSCEVQDWLTDSASAVVVCFLLVFLAHRSPLRRVSGK